MTFRFCRTWPCFSIMFFASLRLVNPTETIPSFCETSCSSSATRLRSAVNCCSYPPLIFSSNSFLTSTTIYVERVVRTHLLRLVSAHVEDVSTDRLTPHRLRQSLAQTADLVALLVQRHRLHVEPIDSFVRTLLRFLQLLLQGTLDAPLLLQIALPSRLVSRLNLLAIERSYLLL